MQTNDEILETQVTTDFRDDGPIEQRYPDDHYLSAKFLLLGIGGGVGYIAAFFGVLPVALVGYGLCAASAISIRKRQQTPQMAAASSAAALVEVLGDCFDGAQDILETQVKPIAAMGARTIARHSGLISGSELRDLEERQGGEVKVPQSVIELIVGSPRNPHNTAILARRQSGKTTLLHGVIHHLLALQQKNIVLVGDPNYGAGNEGELPAWAGLPIYDRDSGKMTIAHHHLMIARDDIYTCLCQLGDLYDTRMREANKAAKEGRQRAKFTPIYFILDEFQTFVGGLNDEQTARVNAVFGDLIRAAKYRIYFFPVLHNDRAENGLNTTNLGGVNLLLLGSVIDALKTDKALNNSRQRFDDRFLERVNLKRIDYNSRYGKGISQKKLGVINLVDGCTTSDGTDFAPGNHLLMVPDYRAHVPVVHDFSGLTETTAKPQDAPAEIPNEIDALIPEFEEWLIANAGHFEDMEYSLTKFSDRAISLGWGKTRDLRRDPHYRFNRELCKQLGGKINPHEIVRNL